MSEQLALIHRRFAADVEAECAAGRSQEHLQNYVVAVGSYVADALFFAADNAFRDGGGIGSDRLPFNKIALEASRCVSRIVRDLYGSFSLPADEAEEAAVLRCWARFDELKSFSVLGGVA